MKNLKRALFAAVFVLLLIVEILIALFVHGGFVRSYLGDVLVVILIYALVRIVIPDGAPWLSGAVFLFAAAVEIAQLINVTELLGLGNVRFFRVLIGTNFDPADVLSYAVGCLLCLGHDIAAIAETKKYKTE